MSELQSMGKREFLHDVVNLLSDADLERVTIMVSALLSDEIVTSKERAEIDEGFAQIAKGDCLSGAEYRAMRRL